MSLQGLDQFPTIFEEIQKAQDQGGVNLTVLLCSNPSFKGLQKNETL